MARKKLQQDYNSYPPPFSLRFLLPGFWPTWLGLGLFRLLTALPAPVRRPLGGLLGALAYGVNKKRRGIVELNLQWCFPERSAAERQAMARRYFRFLGRSLADYGLLWWADRKRLERLIEVEGEEEVRRRLAAGKRVILFTGHTVALDFGVTAISMRLPLVGPMKEARNPLINWIVARGRTRFGGHALPREAGVRAIVRDVRAGRVLFYVPDEDLARTQKSVFAPFFGVPIARITALPRLARSCEAEVLSFTTYFDPQRGRYVLRIFPPVADFPTFDEERDAALVNAELERMIRLAPEQYMWSLQIFRTRPDGSPSPYQRLLPARR